MSIRRTKKIFISAFFVLLLAVSILIPFAKSRAFNLQLTKENNTKEENICNERAQMIPNKDIKQDGTVCVYVPKENTAKQENICNERVQMIPNKDIKQDGTVCVYVPNP